jgi:D-alanine-D-alanine ligase
VSKKILILVHKELIPDDDLDPKSIDRSSSPWITEYDVVLALKESQKDFDILGIDTSLKELLEALQSKKYSIVFNLLEEFKSNTRMESKIVALMELFEQKYTGCNSKGLLIAKDKALSKKILKYHHLATAQFFTFPKGKKKKVPKHLNYPLIIKCLYEEASYGIAKASIVQNEEKLYERVKYIHEQLDQDAIVEEFIEGKEYYVGVLGKSNLKTLPIIELHFDNIKAPEKEIYSSQAKWNENYRKRNGIRTENAKLAKPLEEKINRFCKKSYKALNLSGYARMDLRITKDEQIFLLEANPNPNIASDDDFAMSAKSIGISYQELIESLIK